MKKVTSLFASLIFMLAFATTLFIPVITFADEKVSDSDTNTTAVTVSVESIEISEQSIQTPSVPYCPHIKGYWGLGDKGIVYVSRIQKFLNKYQGEDLVVDGIYGPMTFNAVKRFQMKYKEQILEPWGYTEATGFWYKTTSKMANYLIGCDVIDIELETNGKKVDTFYTAETPARYIPLQAVTTFDAFCDLTYDCHNQTHTNNWTKKIIAEKSRSNSDTISESENDEDSESQSKCGWLRSVFGGCDSRN